MLRYVQRNTQRSWFERPEWMPAVLHRLLIQRGIASAEEAQAFLNPDWTQMHDPLKLHGMPQAVRRIRTAMESGERICIYGDYDVDGVCASAILYDYLRQQGIEAEVYLPSRHTEGYGLNEAALREIAGRADLLVTVDCGISSAALVDLAGELGLDCVVTDHHRPGEQIPRCTVVNPLLGEYPFPWLCGAGVALKLVEALGGRAAAEDRVDLAAIATVADVVSLTGENRVIVRMGLERINHCPRPGLAALMESARVTPGQLTSEGIAFRLAPRLNAGGRLGSARRSYELLVQQDAFEAAAQADELEQENARRQSIEREIRQAAQLQLMDFDFSAHRIILVRGKDWNPGVIGLTASHLREAYNYPVIVFSEHEGMLTGSCRSIEGVDIYQTLSSAAQLMEKFGGHSQAAGLTIKVEHFDALQQALDTYLFENAPAEAYVPSASYDIPAELGEVSEEFVRALAALEPTGCANPEPVLRSTVQLVEARPIGAQGAHLRLICGGEGVRRTGIYFGAGALAEKLGERAEILYTPQLNHWNGRTDVQLRLSALRQADDSARIDALRGKEGPLLRRFLTELLYNRGDSCTRRGRDCTLEELRILLAGGAQGCWILCDSAGLARKIYAAMPPGTLDLALGELPDDARCFNSLIVDPPRLEGFPRSLRTLVLAGMPALEGVGEAVVQLNLEGERPFTVELPDVDQMRQVYLALRYLSRRPAHIPDMEAMCARLAEEAQLDASCCCVALLALADMKLIELRLRPFGLRLLPMQKTDPESSPLWRAVTRLRDAYRREENQ